MDVAVGSANPVKVAAVEAVAGDVFDDAAVTGVRVDSGVSAMPDTTDEAVEGAETRAERALQRHGGDLGVGPEGFVVALDAGLFLSNWVVVTDGTAVGQGGGAIVELPGRIADRVRDGEELGPVTDDVLDRDGVSRAEGTIGVLTDGRYTRQDAFEHATTCALAPFLRGGLYGGGRR